MSRFWITTQATKEQEKIILKKTKHFCIVELTVDYDDGYRIYATLAGLLSPARVTIVLMISSRCGNEPDKLHPVSGAYELYHIDTRYSLSDEALRTFVPKITKRYAKWLKGKDL